MKKIILVLLALAACHAEDLHTWAGCGGGFSNPGVSGFCVLAVPVGNTAYSWTMHSVVPQHGKTPTTSTVTGAALPLRTFKAGKLSVDLVGLGAAGGSSSATASTGSFAGGGGALIHREGSRQGLWLGGLQNKTASGTKTQILLSWMVNW